jgi:uncharacterized protein (TIGR02246 family)
MRIHFTTAKKLFVGSVLLASACAVLVIKPIRAEQADSPGDLAAIRQVTSGIIAADNTGEAVAVIRFYAEDAMLLPPNGAQVVGKDAIRARYEEGFRQFRFAISSSSDETHVFGDLAFDRGSTAGKTVPKGSDPSRQIHDKYVMILHRERDGMWKIARLMWNSAEPVVPGH